MEITYISSKGKFSSAFNQGNRHIQGEERYLLFLCPFPIYWFVNAGGNGFTIRESMKTANKWARQKQLRLTLYCQSDGNQHWTWWTRQLFQKVIGIVNCTNSSVLIRTAAPALPLRAVNHAGNSFVCLHHFCARARRSSVIFTMVGKLSETAPKHHISG